MGREVLVRSLGSSFWTRSSENRDRVGVMGGTVRVESEDFFFIIVKNIKLRDAVSS